MHWQDFVISAGNVVFAIALLPSVLGKDKPAVSTSLMTGIMLLIFAVTFATLSLWYSTVAEAITAIMWLALAVQKRLQTSRVGVPADL